MAHPRKTVYVETSIFSSLVARQTTDLLATARQQTTRIWWQNDADRFSLVTSDVVQYEASEGDPEMARQRLEYIASLPLLLLTPAAERIADSILNAGILPPKARTDALHLGIATVHSLDFLLSWNCKHLANGSIYSRVVKHLTKNGYNVPYVYTPNQLPGGNT